LPLIYAGQEIGETHKPSHFEKEEIDWGNKDISIFDFFKKLVRLRYDNPVLASKNMLKLKTNHSDKIVSFLKIDNDAEALVLINLSNENLEIKIDNSDPTLNDEYLELLQNVKINLETLCSGNLMIKPYQSLLLRSINNNDY
jgi:glycosidase